MKLITRITGRVESVGPHERVPEDFVEKWGGFFGCPAKDRNGNQLGYVQQMPSHESQWNNVMSTFMAL